MTRDRDGWLNHVTRIASPNADARPTWPGMSIREGIALLVIHHISLPPGEFGGQAVTDLFCNQLDATAHPTFATLATLRVSAHFFIQRSGLLTQFVSCHQRAWHAGVSHFQGRERCNDFSLGIELEGTGEVPYTDMQYRTLAWLTRILCARYPIQAIVGHSDIAPGRKTDPGESFDWHHYGVLTALPALMRHPIL